jgi:hypothetical protein
MPGEARRMIEGLARQGDRPVLACRPAPLLREAAHHLHEAVDATVRPWSRRSIGGEPADDESRSQRSQSRRGIAETAQGARAIRVDDDVSGRHQSLERSPSVLTAKVEPRAALAEAAVNGDGRNLLEARRVHAQHVGTVRGEKPRGDRTGDHPREVEDAHAGERSLGRAHRNRGTRRPRLDGNRRAIRDAGSMRMHEPLVARAERGSDATCRDHGGLELLR